MRFKKSTPLDSALSLSKQMAQNLEKTDVLSSVPRINPNSGVVTPVKGSTVLISFDTQSQTMNLKIVK